MPELEALEAALDKYIRDQRACGNPPARREDVVAFCQLTNLPHRPGTGPTSATFCKCTTAPKCTTPLEVAPRRREAVPNDDERTARPYLQLPLAQRSKLICKIKDRPHGER